MSVELITPKIAAEYLDHIDPAKQRRYRARKSRDYADEMVAGEWDERTGDPIRFDTQGNLIDGQHRLNAVIMSGKSYHFLVLRNLPPEIFSKLDIGLKRTGGDVLHIEGAKNALAMSAMVRKYLLLKKGSYGEIGGSQHARTSNTQLKKEYRRRKKWWDALNVQCHEWYREFSKAIKPSEIGGYYAYLQEIDTEDAARFFDKLCTGADVSKNSPIRLLRNYFINKKQAYAKPNAMERGALIFKVWNLFRKHQPLTGKLTFNPDQEEFPKAI